MSEEDISQGKKKVFKRRDTCVLPGEVNPDVVAKGEAGEKICYYEKCTDCGRGDCIVFHPCIHKWICFGCKKTFGEAKDAAPIMEKPEPPAACPSGDCPEKECPIIHDTTHLCAEDHDHHEHDHKHETDKEE